MLISIYEAFIDIGFWCFKVENYDKKCLLDIPVFSVMFCDLDDLVVY